MSGEAGLSLTTSGRESPRQPAEHSIASIRNQTERQPKVAVLLYGMLRTFDLTAAAFRRHIITPNNADIFYFGPEESDVPDKAHGGSLDAFGNLKHNPKGRLDPVTAVNPAAFHRAYGSAMRAYHFHRVSQEEFARQAAIVDRRDWLYGLNPARIFSMLFNMEGVIHLFEEYETAHGLSYDQIIITRPDIGFFSPILANAKAGFLHIPSGEGFDHWGRKHGGNARVLYYKNVETGDFIEGGDRLSFNDQIFVLSRSDLAPFSTLTKAVSEYLSRRVPASPETILYLHLCLRHGLKPVLHREWCYQIQRTGMPTIENVADTAMIRIVDRYHPNAKARFRQDPLGCLLRDVKTLLKRSLHRLLR